MPPTQVLLYQEHDGEVPVFSWLDELTAEQREACFMVLERLEQSGYELRRPVVDMLQDGIYELRARSRKVQLRLLFSYVGQNQAMIFLGCTKEGSVDRADLRRAIQRRLKYLHNPSLHTYPRHWQGEP